MTHLETLLTGKAKHLISGVGYSGEFHSAAWSIQERTFGRPHVIIDARLESIRKAITVKPHNPASLFKFSAIVANFLTVLKE